MQNLECIMGNSKILNVQSMQNYCFSLLNVQICDFCVAVVVI